MKKKLLLLDLVLLTAVAVVAIEARDKWQEASKREQVMLGRKLKPSPPPPYAALPAVQPLAAAAYLDIVQKNLFSADRNPTVIVEVAPPKMPDLPVYYGVMNLGDGPFAMMSVKSGETQQDVRYGEKIGEFVLVAVNRDEIILEWDGKKITKKASDLSPKEPAPNKPAEAAAHAARAAEPQPQATSLSVASAPVAAAPGKDTGGGYRACVPGDTSPAGTVRDGLRKVAVASPFGTICRWEPVK